MKVEIRDENWITRRMKAEIRARSWMATLSQVFLFLICSCIIGLFVFGFCYADRDFSRCSDLGIFIGDTSFIFALVALAIFTIWKGPTSESKE